MTIDEKKQYLNKYRLQQAKIGRINEMIAAFPDDKQRYDKQLLEARHIRNRIEDEIQAIDNEILSELLSQKYLCGRTISEIAHCMSYSIRQIERMHKQALERFEVT